MNKMIKSGAAALMLSGLISAPFSLQAGIPGISGTTFNIEAKANFISTPDGGVSYMWLFGQTGQPVPQYPGPTMIVPWTSNGTVTVNVTNNLVGEPAEMPISFTVPGLNVHCTSCADGPGGSVAPGATESYEFIIKRPGTFNYYSDYRTDLGVAMGLTGAIVIRPNNFAHVENSNAPVPTAGATQKAYGSTQTVYDHEYLILSTDLDVDYHQIVRGVGTQDWETCVNIGQTSCTTQEEKIVALTEALRDLWQVTPGGRLIEGFFPEYWFINGRAAFDNFQGNNLPWLPTQPYSGISQIHPGQTALVRYVGAGRQVHPFHPHGDESAIVAVDGRLADASNANAVSDPGGAAPNLQWREYTIDQIPGQTVDVTWNWMPKEMGFDVYGNTAADYAAVTCPAGEPDDVFEPFVHDSKCIVSAGDRGVPLPTSQPPLSDLAFGGFWSGSPFLGKFGTLPPGEGGLNANGGLAMIWHSHREKELINKDVFPGGLLSIMMVEPFEDADGATVSIPRGSCFDTNNGSGC
ncbi:MAG: multicopper oxidase domain-containing protein [gamma proteobacterium symbiont of Ctena orbiculata]|nr:multicopper oxidase domain-containing protein [Candidatus Thiodiazotropha taylori]MBT3057572.1 multicopper oxidase domain-containing protein [Candidatus Thiodiazotropha sp. (ex Lucina pensylvanica)]MBT3064032.1 multicopper oxidase domain-containing protein [Candidatus Thiodiazotropha sp. (ex Lucina pensylvanica)]MBV2095291.1 multicopper oxidase domain-containing protein [Candidatus Thiodiazotropha sp. (ex Codakia orbicularis)]